VKVGFVGVSHLGQVYSAVTAAAGMDVLLFGDDPSYMVELSQRPTISEPGLDELWQATSNQRVCSTDISDCLACDLIFISHDIPTDEHSQSDSSVVGDLASRLFEALGAATIPIVILSQLAPGSTRRIAAGRQYVSYQVETLVFGQAVERAQYPERFIIGVGDESLKIDSRHNQWLGSFGAPVHVMSYESAELAKIAINLFLAASVSTTNSLAELARAIGADWDDIAPTLLADRRIGPHAYLTPGLGLAGGNIERDLATFTNLAAVHRVRSEVVESFFRSSQYHRDWVRRQLDGLSPSDLIGVAVLGLAYKPNTASTKNSASLAILEQLSGTDVRLHDPVARLDEVPPRVAQVASWQEAVRGCTLLIVMTQWSEYACIEAEELRDLMNGKVIIDPHAALDHNAMRASGMRIRSLRRPYTP
jgi:UDPglucose 6-dehydrogenase